MFNSTVISICGFLSAALLVVILATFPVLSVARDVIVSQFEDTESIYEIPEPVRPANGEINRWRASPFPPTD